MNLKEPYYIFVVGGVCSSLGKGQITASIAYLLKSMNKNVFIKKLDPYLNVDPGTMNPSQHGEVFVTHDGIETDQDLGTYERLTGILSNINSNITSGKIYQNLIFSERQGQFHGNTIQTIPHITNEIINFIEKDNKKYDFVVIEIGGTTGDIEMEPFLEALRQLIIKKKFKICVCQLVWTPLLTSVNQIKTKPAQNAIKMLNMAGIQPNILFIRSSLKLKVEDKKKLALFGNINEDYVFEILDLDNIFLLPEHLLIQNFLSMILKFFNIEEQISLNINKLKVFNQKCHEILLQKDKKNIFLICKYTDIEDSYISLIYAIKFAAIKENINYKITFINAKKLFQDNYQEVLKNAEGIIVPGGFGENGFEGKILACKYARENNIPFLGICYGLHTCLVEFARNVLNLKDANTEEIAPSTKNKVIHLVKGKKTSDNLGGTLRLGNYQCILKKNTLTFDIYKKNLIFERHRHRYEVNEKFLDKFEKFGFIVSGVCSQSKLVEIMELKTHPFYIGCQFHPEFNQTFDNPAPLFLKFIQKVAKIS
ncbi:CTP synthase [symbiont of Argiope bruennichi]|uniref:CTP synthase n=1 Tax=symbiont of Argiope bruennichi TaxID=2810479 RepID=UPI003DA63C31